MRDRDTVALDVVAYPMVITVDMPRCRLMLGVLGNLNARLAVDKEGRWTSDVIAKDNESTLSGNPL
jgi:hypothetical protein